MNKLVQSNGQKLNEAVRVLQESGHSMLADAVMRLETECRALALSAGPSSAPAETPRARDIDAVKLVRWLTARQRELQIVIESYPQGNYQHDLDMVDALLDLVEGSAPPASARPTLDARLKLADDILEQVTRRYKNVEDTIPDTGSFTVYADAKMVLAVLREGKP